MASKNLAHNFSWEINLERSGHNGKPFEQLSHAIPISCLLWYSYFWVSINLQIDLLGVRLIFREVVKGPTGSRDAQSQEQSEALICCS